MTLKGGVGGGGGPRLNVIMTLIFFKSSWEVSPNVEVQKSNRVTCLAIGEKNNIIVPKLVSCRAHGSCLGWL